MIPPSLSSHSAARQHTALARLRRQDAACWAAFSLAALAGFIYLFWKGRGNTFYYDEITWLVTRNSGWHAVISSYNNHLLVIPIAVYQLLFRTVGLDNFWVFRVIGTVGHLACATAVFAFARRRIGWWALLLSLPILILGTGWDYVLWPVNFGFTISIALSILALIVLEGDDRGRAIAACAILVLALAFSEFTVFFALGLIAELSLRDRSPRRAFVWLVPLVLYGAWWLAYHDPTPAGQNLHLVPAYAANLAANATGGLFGHGLNWGRGLLLAGLLLAIATIVRGRRPNARALGLAVTAGSFWLLVALGRAQLHDATASRYVYTGAVLLALLGSELWRGRRARHRLRLVAWAIGLVMAGIAVAGNHGALTQGENTLRAASQVDRAELGVVPLVGNVVPSSFLIDPHYMPGITALRFLAVTRRFGSSPGDEPAQIEREGERARVAADQVLVRAGELSMGRGVRSRGGTGPAVPRLDGFAAGAVRYRRGCLHFDSGGAGAALDVTVPTGGLMLGAAPGPPVALRARRFASAFEGNPVSILGGGTTLSIRPLADASVQPWHLRLSPYQTVLVCRLPSA